MCASVCLLKRRNVDVRREGTAKGGFYILHAQQGREPPSYTWLWIFYWQIHLTCIRIVYLFGWSRTWRNILFPFWRREEEDMCLLSAHFGKKKCECEGEETRYSRRRLLYIASR